MSWKYNFIPPWLVKSETKSSYWHLNSKKWIFMVTSFLSTLNWDYLGYRLSIFSQILICCSWDNSLPAKWHLFLILIMSSQSNLRLKATVHNFFIFACYINGRSLFSQTGICMTMFFAQYLGCYFTIFSQILVCCSWDYKLSVMWSSDF